MKKFAETVIKNDGGFFAVHKDGKTTYEIQGLTSSPLIIFGDWVSPEDHQKVVEDLTNARSSITNLMAQLDYYKKDKRFEAMAEEILSLKSQLEKQQPEIPEFVAEWIKSQDHNTRNRNGTLVYEHYKKEPENDDYYPVHDWIADHFDEFLEALINGCTVETTKAIVTPCPVCGYQDVESNFCGICGHKNEYIEVAKEKRFYLKNKLTGGYVEQDCYNGTRETYNRHDRTAFTQSEIDSMETGSYEQIEVQE